MTHKKQTTATRRAVWLRYLSGQLSDNERYDLEQQLANDPDAQKAMQAIAENELSPSQLDDDLADIQQAWKNRSKKRTRIIPVWVNQIAAVLLIGFGIWAATQYYQDQQNSGLYAQFFETDNYFAVRGSTADDDAFSLALKAYEEKNYESSFAQFQYLSTLVTNKHEAQLYAAMSAMQLGKNFEAKLFLNDVIEQTTDAGKEASAYWYLALVYLQEDKETESKKRLQWLIDNAPNSQWGSQAVTLMEALESH